MVGATLETTNSSSVTEKRLANLIQVTKMTMDLLLAQADEGVLKNIKGAEALNKFNKDIDTLIVSRIRSKFNLQ